MSAATLKKISVVQRDATSAAVPYPYMPPRPKPSLPSTRKTTFDYSLSMEKGDAFSLASTTINESGVLLPNAAIQLPNNQGDTTTGEGMEPQNAAYAWWMRRMKKASPMVERKQVSICVG
jgi:hypothetical protein